MPALAEEIYGLSIADMADLYGTATAIRGETISIRMGGTEVCFFDLNLDDETYEDEGI